MVHVNSIVAHTKMCNNVLNTNFSLYGETLFVKKRWVQPRVQPQRPGSHPRAEPHFSGMPSFEPLNKGPYHGRFPVKLANEEDSLRYPSNKNVFVNGILRSGVQTADWGVAPVLF